MDSKSPAIGSENRDVDVLDLAKHLGINVSGEEDRQSHLRQATLAKEVVYLEQEIGASRTTQTALWDQLYERQRSLPLKAQSPQAGDAMPIALHLHLDGPFASDTKSFSFHEPTKGYAEVSRDTSLYARSWGYENFAQANCGSVPAEGAFPQPEESSPAIWAQAGEITYGRRAQYGNEGLAVGQQRPEGQTQLLPLPAQRLPDNHLARAQSPAPGALKQNDGLLWTGGLQMKGKGVQAKGRGKSCPTSGKGAKGPQPPFINVFTAGAICKAACTGYEPQTAPLQQSLHQVQASSALVPSTPKVDDHEQLKVEIFESFPCFNEEALIQEQLNVVSNESTSAKGESKPLEQEPDSSKRTLIIAYIPRDATRQTVENAFRKFDPEPRAYLVYDQTNLLFKCYGFVRFATIQQAQTAFTACAHGLVILDDDKGKAWHLKASWAQKGYRHRQHGQPQGGKGKGKVVQLADALNLQTAKGEGRTADANRQSDDQVRYNVNLGECLDAMQEASHIPFPDQDALPAKFQERLEWQPDGYDLPKWQHEYVGSC